MDSAPGGGSEAQTPVPLFAEKVTGPRGGTKRASWGEGRENLTGEGAQGRVQGEE